MKSIDDMKRELIGDSSGNPHAENGFAVLFRHTR